MDRNAIELRRAAYAADLERANLALAQNRDLAHTLNGAIQDCDFWLSQCPPEVQVPPNASSLLEMPSRTGGITHALNAQGGQSANIYPPAAEAFTQKPSEVSEEKAG